MSQISEKKPDDSVQAREATGDIYTVDDPHGIDRVYLAKARLLNNAIQEIGMGKYQVCSQSQSPKNVRQLAVCSGGSSSLPASVGSQTIYGL